MSVSEDNMYILKSLTLNGTIACEVIFKWKAGLKEEMDTRLDLFLLSNGYRNSSNDNNDYYWEYAPVTAAKLVLLVTTAERLQLLEEFLLSKG
ncbi:hypothetical protein Tco_1434310 [Tanacetum coccineum]